MKKFHPGDRKGKEISRKEITSEKYMRDKGVLENGKYFKMTKVFMESSARRDEQERS